MTLKSISPQAARELLEHGAALIDVRGADEHARERIPQARNLPVADLAPGAAPVEGARIVVFHCRSGRRTRSNVHTLAASAAQCDAYVLEGGLDAWKQAGLPVRRDRSQPLEPQRQVQIAAGSVALGGTLLGALASPWFYIAPGFVGAGLLLAGLTGFCGMARLLLKMPWNRKAA